jgi:hypothetical protein
MSLKALKAIMISVAVVAAAPATGRAEPAWRPDSRAELTALVRCDALMAAEIAAREKSLPKSGRWTLLHQALWRLEAERDLLSGALAASMDADSAAAARRALLPKGVAALPDRERRRAVNDCDPLVRAVHAAGAEDGDALAPLPRVSFLMLSRAATDEERAE